MNTDPLQKILADPIIGKDTRPDKTSVMSLYNKQRFHDIITSNELESETKLAELYLRLENNFSQLDLLKNWKAAYKNF